MKGNTFKVIIHHFLIVVLIIINLPINSVSAKECGDRYLTIVNPVRGRNLWIDKSLKPLHDQYGTILEKEFPATWLLQHDVLEDKELINQIKKFDKNQELGILLEVSPNLTVSSRVIYPHDVAWFEPQAVFLSGYSLSERERMVDTNFKKFKEIFGYYPKSVGAWWIDMHSLNYLKKRYGIKTAMIVADQKTTDSYGVWGQWWGYPYYPSKINPLVPNQSKDNQFETVVIQWAQRDPIKAYGEGPKISNFSLQANDYIRQGLDTNYFKKIMDTYLDCRNSLGQITVGLETGMESVGFINEYKNQIDYLKSVSNLNALTMSDFADEFNKVFPKSPEEIIIGEGEDKWILTTFGRSNQKLNDKIEYTGSFAFADTFVPDKNKFLNRRFDELPKLKDNRFFPLFLLVIAFFGIVAFFRKKLPLFTISVLFMVSSFGLVFKSIYKDGWKIFFGPVVDNLILIQIILVLASFFLIWIISKKIKNLRVLIFIPLSFGLDPTLEILRGSFISQKYYLGFAIDSLRFVGISFQKPFNLNFVNTDLPSYQASALLRFDFYKIWDNLWLWSVMYPLVHIVVGLILGFLVSKVPLKLQKIIIILFSILLIFHLYNIFLKDPRVAVPNS